MTQKILFSSVCKPIGPSVGDSASVGYELLHGQVTRAQNIYSPRVVHKQFSLDYISENLDAPSTVLHYPSKRTFIKELQKGYDIICIAFVLSTAHHMIKMSELVRKYAPNAKLVLGGYGTVMSDDELNPLCDAICREEGVQFMRNLLGETHLPLKYYKHPDISSRLRIFNLPVAHTSIVFGGLGCPNGCDFCCTSHFFKKKHYPLLPTGKDVFDLMAHHKQLDPNMEHTILDEDFLLNQDRSREFLKLCRESDLSFSAFAFASAKALSQYSFDELLEMGIDGVWVGYEGKQSGYEKHNGRDIDQLIKDLQDHGITVLTSMIIGIPYQSAKIAQKEFASLMTTHPALCQFLIYQALPGTPLYEKAIKEDLLRTGFKNDRMDFYKKCTGFYSTMEHPFMEKDEIEKMQRNFYDQDFKQLGPSILRLCEIKINGYKKYRNHENPKLRQKAQQFKKTMASFLAILPTAILGPKITFKNRIKYLKMFIEVFKLTSMTQKLYLLCIPVVAMAAIFTGFTMKFELLEHPFTRIYNYPGRINRINSRAIVKRRFRGLMRFIPVRG